MQDTQLMKNLSNDIESHKLLRAVFNKWKTIDHCYHYLTLNCKNCEFYKQNFLWMYLLFQQTQKAILQVTPKDPGEFRSRLCKEVSDENLFSTITQHTYHKLTKKKKVKLLKLTSTSTMPVGCWWPLDHCLSSRPLYGAVNISMRS